MRASCSRPKRQRLPARRPSPCPRTTRASCHGKFRIPALHARDAAQGDPGADQPGASRHHPWQRHRPRPAPSRARRDRVHPGRRGHRRPLVAHLREGRRHGRGDDDPRTADGQLESAGVCTLDTGGRISAGRSAAAGLPGRDHPGRPGRQVGRARCRAASAASTPNPCGSSWACATGAAPRRTATSPPRMCHAHHDIPFSEGGATSVANGRLLCGHHHRRIHDPAVRPREAAQRQGQVPLQKVRMACGGWKRKRTHVRMSVHPRGVRGMPDCGRTAFSAPAFDQEALDPGCGLGLARVWVRLVPSPAWCQAGQGEET